MGDFNEDITREDCSGFDKLEEFCDMFNLTNLIKSRTCYANHHKSTIELFLTSKPSTFPATSTTKTGLNDCHKLISTFMRPEKQKKIFRNYIKFDETKFLFGFGKI